MIASVDDRSMPPAAPSGYRRNGAEILVIQMSEMGGPG